MAQHLSKAREVHYETLVLFKLPTIGAIGSSLVKTACVPTELAEQMPKGNLFYLRLGFRYPLPIRFPPTG